jgi:hypothetical protein
MNLNAICTIIHSLIFSASLFIWIFVRFSYCSLI